MKTALITGGAGFIAHHLIARILIQTDWNIVTLDRLDYSGNLNRLNDILQYECSPNERKRVKVVFHDLKAELNPLVRREIGKVDYILTSLIKNHSLGVSTSPTTNSSKTACASLTIFISTSSTSRLQ